MDQAGFSPETLLAQRAWVKALARSLVNDDSDSDDLEQQAWLAAIRATPAAVRHPRAWLATILRREASTARRQDAGRRRREENTARPERVRATADVVADAEIHRAVVEAVLGLDEPYRSTVLLRYFESLPPREVARRQGVPVETVRARTRRGIALLRGRLAPRALAIAAVAGLAGRASAGGVVMKNMLRIVVATAVLVTVGVVYLARKTEEPARLPDRSAGAEMAAGAPDPPPPPEPVTADDPPRTGCPVRVVAKDGAPLPGARVRAVLQGGDEVAADTDASGLLLLPAASSGPAVLWASAPGRALTRVDCVLSAQETRVILERGGVVRLVFEDADGTTIDSATARRKYEEARVPATAEILPQTEFDRWWEPTAVPAPEGTWHATVPIVWGPGGAELAPLAPGAWRAFLPRPGATEQLTSRFVAREGAETSVRVRLVTAGTRRVRAVRIDTGQPLPGARARAWFEFQQQTMVSIAGHPLECDARGEVEIPLCPSGEYPPSCTWRIDADGWSGMLGDPSYLRTEGTAEVSLSRTWEARGIAFLSDGRPAAGRTVLCWQEVCSLFTTRTDAEGRFTFTGLGRQPGVAQTKFTLVESVAPLVLAQRTYGEPPSGPDQRVRDLEKQALETRRARMRDAGNAELRKRELEIGRELEEAVAERNRVPSLAPADVRIGTPAAGELAHLEGRVTSGGTPLPGVRVSVTDDGGSRDATTDSAGAFAVVVAGERCDVVVRLSNRGYDVGYLSGEALSIRRGETRRLDLDIPAGEIVATVLDANTGRPVPHAYVHAGVVDDKHGPLQLGGLSFFPGWTAITDEEGRASLRCLVPGELHHVEAESWGYRECTLSDVVPGSTDRPIVLTLRIKPRP